MAIVDEAMLIMVSANNNNNKFYHVTLSDTGTVTKRYGRVGVEGVSRTESTGRHGFDKVIREKTNKGYKQTQIVSESSAAVKNDNLSDIAKKALVGSGGSNSILEELVDTLVRLNNHDILETSGGLIKVNSEGLMTTPLGLINQNSINAAQAILRSLETTPVSGARFVPQLEEYLSLIPQKVGSKRGWYETFFNEENTFASQHEFLKQLSESLALREERKKAAAEAEASAGATDDELAKKYENLFKFKISVLEDKKEFTRINKLFEGSKTRHHTTSHLKLKRVFVLIDDAGRAVYEKKLKEIGNGMELWHGTGVSNVLSILRKGLYCPPVSGTGIHISGRMYGHGVYFSDISSKSAQYLSYSGSGADSSYMFLSDVALGNTYHPDRYFQHGSNAIQKAGKHDSIFAQGGISRVLNNEMIVWNTDQINMRYLCELGI